MTCTFTSFRRLERPATVEPRERRRRWIRRSRGSASLLLPSCARPGTWSRRLANMGSRSGCWQAIQRLHAGVGCRVRIVDDQPAHGQVQRPAQARLSAAGGGVRLLCYNRPGRRDRAGVLGIVAAGGLCGCCHLALRRCWLSRRSRLFTALRRLAMTRGGLPVRTWEASSAKTTSRSQ